MGIHCKTFIIVLLLINFTLQLNCYGKTCLRCNLRSGDCHTCSSATYFKDIDTDSSTNYPVFGAARTDSKCYAHTSTNSEVTDGCYEWTYNVTTGVESCYRCKEDYWRSYDGQKCTLNNTKKSCSQNCLACYELESSTIDDRGNNSYCTVCKQGYGLHNTYTQVCGTGTNYQTIVTYCGHMAGSSCIECKNNYVLDTSGVCISVSSVNAPKNCNTLATDDGKSCLKCN